MSKKIKRIDCYNCSPVNLDLICPKCEGTNITWSEWEHHIWCYNCKLDVEYNPGFSGPIPIMVAKFIGIDYRKHNIETGKIIPGEVNRYYKHKKSKLCKKRMYKS